VQYQYKLFGSIAVMIIRISILQNSRISKKLDQKVENILVKHHATLLVLGGASLVYGQIISKENAKDSNSTTSNQTHYVVLY